MKPNLRYLVLVLAAAGMIFSAAGCRKARPDDPETQALAKQFMTAVFVTHDAALAMSLVVPIDKYGYVTAKMLDDTVKNEIQKKCSTPAESVQVGAPGSDVEIPELSADDTARGITARTAWLVSSRFTCTGQTAAADRTTVVYLEQVNGKWGISQVLWAIGLGKQSNN
jgi:hypothetical protein